LKRPYQRWYDNLEGGREITTDDTQEEKGELRGWDEQKKAYLKTIGMTENRPETPEEAVEYFKREWRAYCDYMRSQNLSPRMTLKRYLHHAGVLPDERFSSPQDDPSP
jgi:hypothetical protein